MKRVLSIILVLAMMLSLGVTVMAADFSDVPEGAWYTDAVSYVQENGLMSGVSATSFDPSGTTSRAMLATVLYRAAGSPAVSGEDAFTDTQPGAWYADGVLWASQQGLISGYGNGLFGTNDPVNREQIAAILWRYAGSPVASGENFADENDISDFAATAVDWARANGIISGLDRNRFDPKGNATRAQVAVILRGYLTKDEPNSPSASGNGGGNAGNPNQPNTPNGNKVLVAYYSATGSTERVANYIAGELNADTFEITPVNAYSSADLNWTASGSRVNNEHDNPALQDQVELVKDTPDNWNDYDTVFIGYPIWWGIAAWPVNHFITNNDFTGKTVIPFCTSSSSGLGQSGTLLADMAGEGDWQTGMRFSSGASESTVTNWVKGLNLPVNQRPADASHITSVKNVPLITLNNGVQVPQLGLGTQIQRLENDRSEAGRKLLNDTSHDAVVAALQAGYRHLDTAHGYYNETGVGQAIIDSGVPREEIWVTSKLWPSEYGEGTTMQAIDDMLERLQLDYLDCIYLHHPAGDYMGAWKDLEKAYEQGKVRALGISNFDNWPKAFNDILNNSTVKPQIMQIEGHPFAQRQETRALAQRYNIQVECWYPLGHADDRLLNNNVLSQIAQAHNKSVVQVILRWHMQEGLCAVPGSTNPSHIQENIDIFDFALTDAEMAQIRAMDRGEAGRYFNINYEQMGGFFTNPLV